MKKKFYKTDYNKMVAGVCNGIAEYFNADVSLVRLVFVIITISGIGSPILLYIILAVILPTKAY